MSLKGSLETVGLTDVLTLLAMTSKTGELQVTGPHGDGRLWVEDGQLIASKAGRGPSHVDAIFELLRVKAGNFSFEDGGAPDEPGPPTPVEPLVAEATVRLGEWDDIEAAIPSLAYVVAMVADAPTDEITIRADQWRLLVATGGGRPVSAVLDLMEFGEFDGCKALKELVDSKLISVEEGIEPVIAAVVPLVVVAPPAGPVEASVPAYRGLSRVSGEVDLSPIANGSHGGHGGEVDLTPIHTDSFGSDDDPAAPAPDFQLDEEPGETADVATSAPAWSLEPFEPFDEIEVADPATQLSADDGESSMTEADGSAVDGPPTFEATSEIPPAAEGYQAPEPDPGYQAYQPDQGYQAATAHGEPLGYQPYQPDQGYQPAAAHEEPEGYQASPGYHSQHTDKGLSADQGYRPYQADETAVDPTGPAAGGPGASATTDPEAGAAKAAKGEPDADGSADAPVTPADEPINRGLLLKFLSSVRT